MAGGKYPNIKSDALDCYYMDSYEMADDLHGVAQIFFMNEF